MVIYCCRGVEMHARAPHPDVETCKLYRPSREQSKRRRSQTRRAGERQPCACGEYTCNRGGTCTCCLNKKRS